MRHWILLSLLLCCGLVGAVIRDTAKRHHALCVKLEDLNVLRMYFRVKLNSDPVGAMEALDKTDFNLIPAKFTEEGCNIAYDTTNKVYTVTSDLDLDTVNAPDRNDNLCGMTTNIVGGVATYEWFFMHNIRTNNFDMLDDKDRVYHVTCTVSGSVSNVVSTSSSVSAPNVIQNVTPASLSVNMFVEAKTGTNTYVPVTGTINAGTIVRLKIEYDRGGAYSAGRDVYGVNAFLLEAGSTSSLDENDYLINQNGCATRAGDATYPATLPILMDHGFRGAISGNKYVLTTGDITLWKYQATGTVFFKAFYDVCYEPSIASCTNLCQVKTGSTTLRRRRNADERDYGTTLTYIRVSDENDVEDKDKEASDSRTMFIAVGSALGALVVIAAVVMVCLLVFFRRTRREENHRRFENMSTASSTITGPK